MVRGYSLFFAIIFFWVGELFSFNTVHSSVNNTVHSSENLVCVLVGAKKTTQRRDDDDDKVVGG